MLGAGSQRYCAPCTLVEAKHLRDKDEADFLNVLPTMDQTRRSRLSSWLSQVHPGHRWIKVLAIHRPPILLTVKRPLIVGCVGGGPYALMGS